MECQSNEMEGTWEPRVLLVCEERGNIWRKAKSNPQHDGQLSQAQLDPLTR